MIQSYIHYAFVDSVADKLKTMDMAVFCMDKNSELVTFTESKLGPVSLIYCTFCSLRVFSLI